MRVNHTNNSPTQGSEASATRHGGRSAPTHGTKGGHPQSSNEVEKKNAGDANTEISSRSKEFAHVKGIASRAPDVREDKISEIKRRLAEGKYQVDNSEVADRLVEDHLRMPEGHSDID